MIFLKRKYFVSYSHTKGFGNVTMVMTKPKSMSDLKQIREAIEKNSPDNLKGVVILNFQTL